MSNRPADEVFAQHLLKAGFVTEVELRSALQAQADSAAKGTPLPLGDILVQQGLLTPAQREKAEKKLEIQREEAKRLGPYRIVRKLGEGGMGAVYLAEDTANGQKVALKVLPKVAAKEEDAVRRFLRELDSARKLDHPNIVRAGVGGEDKGFHYYIMEYVEGETLGSRLKREEALSPDEATKVVLQVAHGLKYAHGQGFIHRDIKPDNIIVSKNGVSKILDMGLSKNIDEAQTFRTVTGVALGTPHYIAPEQARGDKSIDGRADIYSLGATYYHLVTGETPFHGTTAIELIAQHLNKQIPDPRDIRDGIPDGVVHVIRNMMAKKPKDRYRDCSELVTDLELVLGGRNPSSQALDAAHSAVALPMAREARERYRAQRRGQRPGTYRATTKSRSSAASLLIGGVVAAVVLVIVLAMAMGGSSPPTTPPAVAKKQSEPEPSKLRQPEKPSDAAGLPEGKRNTAAKTREELRQEEAKRKLDEIKEVDKSGRFAADEIRRRYAEFAKEYADTSQGKTITDWLKATDPKPEEPKVADVPNPPEPTPPAESVTPAGDQSVRPLAKLPIPQGLIGWWNLDEGSGTTARDASRSGNDATLMNGPAWVAGRRGIAVSFDGVDDYLSMPDGMVQTRVTLTVGAWFKTTRGGVILGYQSAAYPTFPAQKFVPALYVGTDGKLRGKFWNGNASPVTSAQTVNDGKWHHVALVGNATTQTLYLDGAAVGTLSGAIDQIRMTKNQWGVGLADGTWPSGMGGWYFFQGQLDDIRIYNRALSAEEIQSLWHEDVVRLQPSARRPASIPADAVEFKARHYKLYEEQVTWQEAKSRCEKLGGHLATIGEHEENDFVRKLLTRSQDAWIGLTDEGQEGRWSWVTGEPVRFTAWASNEPSNGGATGKREAFVGYYAKGGLHWNDFPAHYHAAFICEWEPTSKQSRPAVPDVAKQREAEVALKKAFPIDKARTLEEKANLGRTLLASAATSGAKEAELYVLLRTARELGLQAGDAKTVLEALDRMGAAFDVDSWAEKVSSLAKTPPKGADSGAWAQSCLDAAEQAGDASEYDAAVKLSDRAATLGRLTNDKWLAETAQERSREMTNLKREADRLKEHFKTLETNPDDPQANAAVGRFMCLTRGDWTRGLPMLGKGSDTALKNLAEQELGNPTDAAAQAALGETWAIQAEKEGPTFKTRCRVRAQEWLRRAIPNLTGLAKATAEKKLESLETSGGVKGQLILDLGGGVNMELVYIKPGIFMTGDGQPGQRVELTKGYYIGKYEVTCGQFNAFVRATGYQGTAVRKGGAAGNAYNGNWTWVRGMDWRTPNFKQANPTFAQTDDHPVTCVSWEDAKAFCDWVSKKNGRGVRFPTEGEWEYACRARTATRWSWGDEESKAGEYAWTKPNTAEHTHPVGQKKPNSFGLYDMHGNVWEWCEDWWSRTMGEGRDPQGPSKGDRHSIRGGSWWETVPGCHSAYRTEGPPNDGDTRIGFRVASR